MKKRVVLFSSVFLFLAALAVNAQYTSSYTGAWSTTWNNPTSSLASVMIQGYINKKMLEQSVANQKGRSTSAAASPSSATPAPARSQTASPPANYAVLRFRPVANSGVPKQVADALTTDIKERAALQKIFQEIKTSYDAEAAKGGRPNNVAAALTFFLTVTSMVYHQTDEPAESVTNALFEVLQQEMSAAPEFKSMNNLQKQQMNDWLVVAGGFVLAGYVDGLKTNDAKELADYRELANQLFKIVMKTGVEKFNLASIGSESGRAT